MAVTVLSYNVNFGSCYDPSLQVGSDHNREQVARAIAESSADVVCLQETHSGWEHFLWERLHDTYPLQRFHNPDAWLAGGIALLLRPGVILRDLQLVPPAVEGSFFAPLVAKVQVGETVATVVNLHLRPPLPMGNGGLFRFATVADYLWRTPKIRQQEVEHALSSVPQEGALVVCGDFNEGCGSGACAWLEKAKGLKDALPRNAVTWVWPLSLFTLRGSYDHIWHDSRLTMHSCRVLDEYLHASDHLPVVATFHPSSPPASPPASGVTGERRSVRSSS
eukprot:TRINITY_DN833_c0_g1_i1.p1 TRINITY_DN833_c0_g1~~TRINITY_DN833_c0_g1_i1.p1  ORF type:complete len:286 (+),score=44.44 TRINITY_DN833_c0_g1_i1:25-858(+)